MKDILIGISDPHFSLIESLINSGQYSNYDNVIASALDLLAAQHSEHNQRNLTPAQIDSKSDIQRHPKTNKRKAPTESIDHSGSITDRCEQLSDPDFTNLDLDFPASPLPLTQAPVSSSKKDKVVKNRRNFQNKVFMYTEAVPTGCVDMKELKCPAGKYSHIPFFALALETLGLILKINAQRCTTVANLFLSIIDFPISTPSYTEENFQQQFKKNIINKLESIKNIQEWHELTAWRETRILFAATQLALHYVPNASYLRDYHQRLTYIKKFNWQFVFFDAVTPRYRVATPDYALNINRNVKPPVVTVKPLFSSSPLQTIAEDKNEPNEFKVNTQPETHIPAPLDALITQSFPITAKGQKRRYEEINSLSPNREDISSMLREIKNFNTYPLTSSALSILAKNSRITLTSDNKCMFYLILAIADFTKKYSFYKKSTNLEEDLNITIKDRLNKIQSIEQWYPVFTFRQVKKLKIGCEIARSYCKAPYIMQFLEILQYMYKNKLEYVNFNGKYRANSYKNAFRRSGECVTDFCSINELTKQVTFAKASTNQQQSATSPTSIDFLASQLSEVENLPPSPLSSDPFTPSSLFINFPTGPATPGTLLTPMSQNSFRLFSPTQIPLPQAADEQEKTSTEPMMIGSDPFKPVGR